jgi:hypothetical protein
MSYGSNLVLEETSVGCQFMNMQLVCEEIYVVVCTFGFLSQDVIPFPPFVVKGRSHAGISGNRFPKSRKRLQGRTLKTLKFLNTFSVFYN